MQKKTQSFDVLIIYKDNLIGELFSILTNYYTGLNCYTVSSIGNAQKILKDRTDLKLVVVDFFGFKDSAVKLVFECIRKKFLIFTNDFIPRITKDPHLYKEYGGLEKYSGETERLINNFQKAIIQFFEKEIKENKNQYLSLPLPLLLHFKNLGGNLFIRLISGRYLKMFRKEDIIIEDDIHKLTRRQVSFLYLEKENALDIIKIILNNEEDVTKALKNRQVLNFVTPDQIKKKMERIQDIMPLSDQELKGIELNIQEALRTIEQIPKFSKFMKFFKVNPDEANYYASHIQLTCRLSCGLAKEMGLANPQAIKKLVFTSYLHDISLIKNPKLAEINTKSKFNKMKNSLTKEDIDLILKHHEDSSEISLKFQGIPLEVDSIIKQHHNIEDGITSVKSAGEIPLFSAIFIISHDLSDYIFLNKKWTIEDFIFEKKSIYSKGNLLRVLKEMDRKED
jgi:HD-GYP domain-containing protein (c-di-GMP phosphodiesterase class II)